MRKLIIAIILSLMLVGCSAKEETTTIEYIVYDSTYEVELEEEQTYLGLATEGNWYYYAVVEVSEPIVYTIKKINLTNGEKETLSSFAGLYVTSLVVSDGNTFVSAIDVEKDQPEYVIIHLETNEELDRGEVEADKYLPFLQKSDNGFVFGYVQNTLNFVANVTRVDDTYDIAKTSYQGNNLVNLLSITGDVVRYQVDQSKEFAYSYLIGDNEIYTSENKLASFTAFGDGFFLSEYVDEAKRECSNYLIAKDGVSSIYKDNTCYVKTLTVNENTIYALDAEFYQTVIIVEDELVTRKVRFKDFDELLEGYSEFMVFDQNKILLQPLKSQGLYILEISE